jgi:hypothetical protein
MARALKQVCVRVFDDAEERAGAIREADETQPTRNQVLRVAVDIGLGVLEERHGVKKAKRR